MYLEEKEKEKKEKRMNRARVKKERKKGERERKEREKREVVLSHFYLTHDRNQKMNFLRTSPIVDFFFSSVGLNVVYCDPVLDGVVPVVEQREKKKKEEEIRLVSYMPPAVHS